MLQEDFVGAWQLQSWTVTLNDKTTYPFGEDAQGLLVYTDDGYMTAIINASDRPVAEAKSVRKLPQEKKAQLFDGCFAYAGSWYVEGRQVVHCVVHSHNPDFVGTKQFREFQFDKDLLILSAREEAVDIGSRLHKLTWRRAESNDK